jgi:hypothetical protein
MGGNAFERGESVLLDLFLTNTGIDGAICVNFWKWEIAL